MCCCSSVSDSESDGGAWARENEAKIDCDGVKTASSHVSSSNRTLASHIPVTFKDSSSAITASLKDAMLSMRYRPFTQMSLSPLIIFSCALVMARMVQALLSSLP